MDKKQPSSSSAAKPKHVDRRVQYTKMVIKNSFIELLTDKPISQTTVKEICERADINRATFYSHYHDQYDLFEKIESELLHDIQQRLPEDNFVSDREKLYQLLMRILQYVRENEKVCLLLLGERNALRFQKQVMMLMKDHLMSQWKDELVLKGDERDYYFVFFLLGCLGIIQKWLEDGMQKSNEVIAQMIINVTQSSVHIFAGHDASATKRQKR